jgi:Ran GTPase-activating protein (RanGAP) involved in mRNA processing and transport
MNTYPSLLNIEDSQRDTPITIALKECSYYLCKYSKQNNGTLDDGTSYSDNEFNHYYPEMENVRDLCIHYGEFIRENCDVYILNAEEAVSMKEFGNFKEIQGLFEVKPTFYGKILSQRQAIKEAAEAAAALERELEAPGDGPQKVIVSDDASLRAIARKKAKDDADAVVAERQSLFAKRFPEDDVMDDYEFGQMSSWGIVGLSVPDVNLFINDDDVSDSEFDINATIDDDGEDLLASKQFIVKSTKSLMEIKNEFVVTKDHHVVSKLRDWDFIKKSKKSVQNKSTFRSIMDAKKVLMDGGGEPGEPMSFNAQLARDREIRFKICKFAEILLSDEIVINCKNMKWDLVTYKELNKLNSSEQGRLCQHLAMVCALNPPPRFTRISEWKMGVSKNIFDEHPEEPRNPAVHYSVTIVEGASKFGKMMFDAMDNMANIRGGRFIDDNATDKTGAVNTGSFGDRVVQFLAECFVSGSSNLLLSDCELSVYGRVGWRAMVRALRRQNCTFVLPSIFVGPKKISIRFLDLSRNELDDGDCVLISEIFLYQQTIVHANLSFNRIGARGVSRIVKVLKGHQSITTMYLHNNRIGPGCAKDVGVWLKQTTTLKVLDLSHNRLGELIRYPTLLCRERIISAVRDIFFGVKSNKTLQILDVSYNHLGPKCADIIPVSVNRHPRLSSLNLSGNDIGPVKGASMIFALAGDSGGELNVEAKISLLASLKNKSNNDDVKNKQEALQVKVLAMKKASEERRKKLGLADDEEEERSTMIANIELADNRLGFMAGHALCILLQKNKFLTSLDVSSNSLGYDGGLALTEGLERVYGVEPRDFFKLTLHRLEEEQYHGRDAKIRKKVWTNLISLNLSRNGLGPDVLSSMMHCMASKKCTITDLNLCDNPLGDNLLCKGNPDDAGIDARRGMGTSGTLTQLNLSNCMFSPVQVVPMVGGLSENNRILKLIFRDTYFDEPCCLQLMHALQTLENIIELDLKNCLMGPKGSGIVVNSILPLSTKLIYLDLSGNKMGPSVSVPFSIALADPLCSIQTFNVADNDFTETGGIFLSQGIVRNKSLEQIDISYNRLTLGVVEVLSDPANGLSHILQLKKFIISNNPLIGNIGANMLLKSLAAGPIEHIEASNIGAGQRTALLISKALRDVELAWRYIDISSNNLSREGLNEIFWSMRQNRSIRVLLIGGNGTGPLFATENDSKLVHGVALPRAIRANFLIRELDISFNGLSAQAGCLLLDAMVDNYTIRRMSVRGNYFDDTVASMLADVLKYNNVLEYIDIGENKLGYNSCFSIAEGLECNRSLKTFCVDYNLLGNAGTATTESFCRALMMNYSLRTLVLDGNKFGPEWGIQLGHMISRNNTLTHISLRDNRFDIRSGKCLVNSFEHNYHLMELALSADEIGEKLWVRFKKIYNKRRSTIGPDDIIFETKVSIKDDLMMKFYE